ncbi:hypothetical protein GTCCBUS3UF5_29450 [Geobacillus thermoleovorans CCB_US3_UF5]|uniref:Uncharacterized protein n=1 Tax=Geobacillus thermoleovorans CCB_US3_UF5 TaxID=1111068 RepID=A0ABM5MKF7_GEOTH|nr:hypothetical protein GTCCBUS3UF5_29450 [Geobacillus thermoleovorans CCB_US3_UF5]
MFGLPSHRLAFDSRKMDKRLFRQGYVKRFRCHLYILS